MSEELAFGAHIPSGELQNEYLSFWADRQLFAVPIREVRKIIRMQKIVEVPDYPPYARGIINLRGDIIPIIDVRMRLGKPEIPYNDRTCIIIIDVGGHQYGIVVDQVSEVMEITKQQFSLGELAEEFHLSQSYITRIIKQETGSSFSELLTRMRIDRAVSLLVQNPDMKLVEIAERTGFASQHYFSRVFKEKVGFSPADYRRYIRKSP